MVSAEGTDSVRADIVKHIHGAEHPDGSGFIEKVETPASGYYRVKKKYVQVGSFVKVEGLNRILELSGSFTLLSNPASGWTIPHIRS